LQKARNLWVLRTPQNNKEEGARAKKLVTCGTRGKCEDIIEYLL